jgi:hypothetical protein
MTVFVILSVAKNLSFKRPETANVSSPRIKIPPPPLFQRGVLKSPFGKGGFRGIWIFTVKSPRFFTPRRAVQDDMNP